MFFFSVNRTAEKLRKRAMEVNWFIREELEEMLQGAHQTNPPSFSCGGTQSKHWPQHSARKPESPGQRGKLVQKEGERGHPHQEAQPKAEQGQRHGVIRHLRPCCVT